MACTAAEDGISGNGTHHNTKGEHGGQSGSSRPIAPQIKMTPKSHLFHPDLAGCLCALRFSIVLISSPVQCVLLLCLGFRWWFRLSSLVTRAQQYHGLLGPPQRLWNPFGFSLSSRVSSRCWNVVPLASDRIAGLGHPGLNRFAVGRHPLLLLASPGSTHA